MSVEEVETVLQEGVPLKYDPRPQQEAILNHFKESVQNDKQFHLIDAPVGVGKSFAGLMMADWYRREVDQNAKVDLLTNTKILQTQYTDDFDFIHSIWGKGNYYCDAHETNCAEGEELEEARDDPEGCRADCPYQKAKSSWTNSVVGLTNFHLFSAYSMYAPMIWEKRNSNVLIIDEAHSFEEVLCGFLSTAVSFHKFKKLKLDAQKLLRPLEEEHDLFSFRDYCRKWLQPAVAQALQEHQREMGSAGAIESKRFHAKQSSKLDRYLCRLNRFIQDEDSYGNWIIVQEEDEEGRPKISVEPVWGGEYMWRFAFERYDQIILMSGTILSKDLFSFLFQFPKEQTSYLQVDSPFPVNQRPIHQDFVGRMSWKHKEDTKPEMAEYIQQILNVHPNQKGIIHTGNYENAWYLKEQVDDDRLLIPDTSERDEALREHQETERPTVLVSPSMHNGIDLKDHLSRFQVVMKVPYPSLSDPRIRRRKETNEDWYEWRTVCDLVQAYGRSIRSKEDWADTYILDESFKSLRRHNGHLLPDYFNEALR